MSTYNRSAFLPQSIESLLSQTFKDFEFVLVNNGSVDNSAEICKHYSDLDNRIKLIDLKVNYGASNGRNVGLSNVTGDYITFVDDDDYCYPEMLQFLWDLLEGHNADISMCGSWNKIDGRLEPYFIFDDLLILNKVEGLDELLKRQKYNVAPPTKLFRRELFDDIRFKQDVMVDDIHVIYKVFANAEIVVAQGRPLYNFTKHNGNMTSFIQTNVISPDLLNEYLLAFRERTEYLTSRVPDIAMRVKYSELSFMISMCNKIPQSLEYQALYDKMIKEIMGNYQWLDSSPYITDIEREFVRSLFS
ncbi:glycosyl transferase [Bacillus sp. FJAT-27264]|nr:glycosyl transferase [Bacillus sp. FJAT-27264]